MNSVSMCYPQNQHSSFESVMIFHWPDPGIIVLYPMCLVMMNVFLDNSLGWFSSVIRFWLTMLWSLSPALKSLQCSFSRSSGVCSYSHLGFMSNKLIMFIFFTGLSGASLFLNFFGRGAISTVHTYYLALILARIHSITSSLMPSLPHRWIAYRLSARVR